MTAPAPRGRRPAGAAGGVQLNDAQADLLRTELLTLIATLDAESNVNDPQYRHNAFRSRQLTRILRLVETQLDDDKDDDTGSFA